VFTVRFRKDAIVPPALATPVHGLLRYFRVAAVSCMAACLCSRRCTQRDTCFAACWAGARRLWRTLHV